MKFSAVLQDVAAIESFIRLLHATCKLGKRRCCLKIQTDGLCFISCANLHDGGSWFNLFLPCTSQLFRRFEMVGLNPRSPDHNYIYMEIDVDILVRILPGGHCYLKIKLSKTPTDEPVLALEVRNPDSEIVEHQVPITIILSKSWSSYSKPSLGHKKMSINLPPAKVVYRFIHAYRSMNAKVFKFTASSNGDLRISSTIEHGEIDALFSDLPTNVNDSDSQEDTASVQLMLKHISAMFQSFTFSHAIVKMNIISHRMAEFTLNSESCTLSFVVGNVTD